jgi:hypothetical protein
MTYVKTLYCNVIYFSHAIIGDIQKKKKERKESYDWREKKDFS